MALKLAPTRHKDAKNKESDKAVPISPEIIINNQSLMDVSGINSPLIMNNVGINKETAIKHLKKFNESGEIFSPLFLNRMTEMDQKNAAPTEHIMPNVWFSMDGLSGEKVLQYWELFLILNYEQSS